MIRRKVYACNEYVAESDKKRSFISGFTGSAGTALVTLEDQLLWTDGRYFLEAADQLDCNWFLMKSGQPGVLTLTEWVLENLQRGQKIGANAKVISTVSWKYYVDAFGQKGIEMVQTAEDLVGKVWDATGERPPQLDEPIYEHEMQFAGRSWEDKIKDLREKMMDDNVDAVVVSALDEVAWLFNLRGADIAYNPVFFAYAIVEKSSSTNPKLYLREHNARLSAVKAHLNCGDDGQCPVGTPDCVNVLDYAAIESGVQAFNDVQENKTVWISDSTNYYISALITNKNQIKSSPSPLLLMKAVKNSVERDGMRHAHIVDSAVIIQLITRLEKELNEGIEWTEIKVGEEIDKLRMEQVGNRGLSFNTIAGSGKNGAYIHYSATEATNNAVNKNNMLLLDSGGQYLNGTTDITRTFHFGEPTDFQKLAYTLVLLGVIDLAMVKFPANKTLGSSLDTLARRPLWQYGLDYGHGTGHGIGMFLNVHEGPARIAGRRASSSVSNERPVYDGMFFSDEPGYYDEKRGFGVRLETIVMAKYMSTEYGQSDNTLGFEAIAFVPFEKKLIKLELLSESQRKWLNTYHRECREKTGVYLKNKGMQAEYDWLYSRTEPVPVAQQTLCSGGNSNFITMLVLSISAIINYL
ncbi:XPNPEP2 [Bugula neritina]|uniref:XPNPEP2 n=1 Tax=Bugula neritina TaxID=10212 RepID=A0A7J7JMH6_BUGNE|nr:XPNPEP2 [Bugula neritina]